MKSVGHLDGSEGSHRENTGLLETLERVLLVAQKPSSKRSFFFSFNQVDLCFRMGKGLNWDQ